MIIASLLMKSPFPQFLLLSKYLGWVIILSFQHIRFILFVLLSFRLLKCLFIQPDCYFHSSSPPQFFHYLCSALHNFESSSVSIPWRVGLYGYHPNMPHQVEGWTRQSSMRIRVPKSGKESEIYTVSTISSAIRRPSYTFVPYIQRAQVSPVQATWLSTLV